MITVMKPLMSGKTKQTFLDPFNLADKAEPFDKVLKSFFIKGMNKNMTTFITGFKKESAMVHASNRKADNVEVEISTQLLEISEIQDINGRTIFVSNEKVFGWFIFIDENIFANWGHDCKYIFFINDKMFFEEHMLLPPNTRFPMEVVR